MYLCNPALTRDGEIEKKIFQSRIIEVSFAENLLLMYILSV